jgi:hypothetical protein
VALVPFTPGTKGEPKAALRMTEWYWPTRVERVEALPRNHMGKVERARLRTRCRPGSAVSNPSHRHLQRAGSSGRDIRPRP